MRLTTRQKWRVAIACLLACYLGVLYWMQRCPPVEGVVVDIETGKPLAGVQVYKTAVGPTLLAFEAHVYFTGARAITTTDDQGRFRFQAALATNGPLCILPIQWINGARLIAYSEEHITVQRQDDPWTGSSWALRKSRLTGFEYKIEMTKAQNQKQWLEKCGELMDAANYLPNEVADEWLFNDLYAYLERWPTGERAGRYYECLWMTAGESSCEYMQDDLRRGYLTRGELEIYFLRGEKILKLAKKFPSAPDGINSAVFLEQMKRQEKSLDCAKALLAATPAAWSELYK